MLANNKAPGIDGLPTEIFKMFWNELKDSFLEVPKECFKKGSLPNSMKMSIITLIYKKKSREDIKNYRPISLLCSDYKIIAKFTSRKNETSTPKSHPRRSNRVR
jgi:hypothetical protein